MSTDARPSILLVHGAWHGSWCWEDLLPHLRDAGYDARTVDLPSAGSAGPMADDAATVRAALAEQPGPTLVVGHSYGGIVVSEGAAGAENVAGLFYLCAFMIEEGDTLLATVGSPPEWVEADPAAGTSVVTRPLEAFYADCAPEVAERAASRLRPQSLSAFTDAQTAAAWREVPSTYVICDRDQAIPPAIQETMSARAQTVHRLDASHSPFLSRPGETAALIAQAAA